MENTLRFLVSNPKVATISSLTRAVAVAVRQMIGTSGKESLKNESSLKVGRKSWPHSEIQWASSIAMRESSCWEWMVRRVRRKESRAQVSGVT